MKRNKIILKTTLPKSNKKGIIESNKEVIPEGEVEEIPIENRNLDQLIIDNEELDETNEESIEEIEVPDIISDGRIIKKLYDERVKDVDPKPLPLDKEAFIWDDKVITQKKDESDKPKKKNLQIKEKEEIMPEYKEQQDQFKLAEAKDQGISNFIVGCIAGFIFGVLVTVLFFI